MATVLVDHPTEERGTESLELVGLEASNVEAVGNPCRWCVGATIEVDPDVAHPGDETAIPHVPRVQRPQVRDRRPSSGPSSARVNADAAELVELDPSRGAGRASRSLDARDSLGTPLAPLARIRR